VNWPDIRDFEGDADTRSKMVACAGILAAASRIAAQTAVGPVNLNDLSFQPELGHLPWALPRDGELDGLGLTDTDALTETWIAQLKPLTSDTPLRLLVDVEDHTPQELDEVTTTVTQLLFGPACDAYYGIGSLCLTVPKRMSDHSWSWPYQIRMDPQTEAVVDANLPQMFARNLVDRLPSSDDTFLPIFPDIQVARFEKSGEIEASGLTILVMDPDSVTSDADWALAGDQLIDCAGELGRPVALIALPDAALPSFLDLLIRETSHDIPLDLALTYADHHVRCESPHRTRLRSAILAAPAAGLTADLERGRVRARLPELLDQLAPVPNRVPVTIQDIDALYRLRFSKPPLTAGGLRAGLRRAIRDSEYLFDRESDGGSGIRGMKQAVQQSRASAPRLDTYETSEFEEESAFEPDDDGDFRPRMSETSSDTFSADMLWADDGDDLESMDLDDILAPEENRKIDVVLRNGHVFTQAEADADANTLHENSRLAPYSPYTLDISIRLNRVGISVDADAPDVLNPRKGKEPLTLWARVDSPTPHLFDFQRSLQSFVWPFDNDSERALIRFDTRGADMGQDGVIEIRIYSDAMDLLELVELRGIRVGANSNLHLNWPPGRPAKLDSATVGEKRMLNLHITGAQNGYAMDVIWRGPGSEPVGFRLDRPILAGDLEKLNTDVRNYWAKLALGVLENRNGLSERSYAATLKALTPFGERAWRTLFGSRTGAQADSAAALGALIAASDTEENQLIQISHGSGSEGFVFPWALLRPPRARGDKPEWGAFWGLRHRIEPVYSGVQPNGLEAAPVQVITAEDPNFAQSESHFKTLRAMTDHTSVSITDPVPDADSLLDALNAEDVAHLFYFFCHGYAPDPHVMPREVLKAWKKGEAGAHFEGIAERPEVAAISFGGGRVTDDDLAQLFGFEGRRPIFFLNMCQSAETAVGRSDGLMRVLMEKNAAAVIGTECEMTAVFASAFSEDMLAHLFAGTDVGTALRDARLRFHQARNPLGLAYSLSGRADTRLGAVAATQ
jgi:hypothetical protein